MVVDHNGADNLFGWFCLACPKSCTSFFHQFNKFISSFKLKFVVVILLAISASFPEVLTRKQIVYNKSVLYFVNTVVY